MIDIREGTEQTSVAVMSVLGKLQTEHIELILKLGLCKRRLHTTFLYLYTGVETALGYFFGKIIAEATHLGTQTVKSLKLGIKLGNSENGDDAIGNKQRITYGNKDIAKRSVHDINIQFYDRMNDKHRKQYAKSPGKRKTGTYVSAEIEGLFAVIPPSHMKELIQNKAADKFNKRRKGCAAYKKQKKMML